MCALFYTFLKLISCFGQRVFGPLSVGDVPGHTAKPKGVALGVTYQGGRDGEDGSDAMFTHHLIIADFTPFTGFINGVEHVEKFIGRFFACVHLVVYSHEFFTGVSGDIAHGVVEED